MGSLALYNSTIPSNRYRIALRVKAWDKNNDGVLNLNNSDATSSMIGDSWEYHFWYQTKTGQWAEKDGSSPSHLISGTSGSTNPGSSSNDSLWGGTSGGSSVYYMYNTQDTSN